MIFILDMDPRIMCKYSTNNSGYLLKILLHSKSHLLTFSFRLEELVDQAAKSLTEFLTYLFYFHHLGLLLLCISNMMHTY